ncbi:MAG: hypothetical protein M0T81_00640 [Thermoplasmatales archaeon]|nr:hypothetical protein [Thermoplasmatales archaeon]
MNLLRISRKTFHVCSMGGKLRYAVMPDDSYYYNDEDVCRLINRTIKRKTIIYARAPKAGHINDPECHTELLNRWCFMGNRIKRGIFGSIHGTLIYAKLNGLNRTVKKEISKAFANCTEVVEAYLRNLSIRRMIISKGEC